MSHKFYKYKTYTALFLAIFTLYLLTIPGDYKTDLQRGEYRRLMPAADVIPNTFLPYQIIKNQTLKFNEIRAALRVFDGGNKNPYFLYTNNLDQTFSVYPILTGIFALPFYSPLLFISKTPNFFELDNLLAILVVGRVAAAFYTALSSIIFYKILSKQTLNNKLAILFTFFYALGTTTASISSRGLWQHTISQLLNTIALYLLLNVKENQKSAPWIGFILGLSVLARPTNIVFAAMSSLYLLTFITKKNLVKFIIIAIPLAGFMYWYNSWAYGSPFVDGYAVRNDLNWSTPLRESLLGFLASPARSFLFISPPLLLTFYTMYKVFRSKQYLEKNNLLYRYLTISIVLTILLIGKWYTWHGANAFGYRMLTDILPILGLFTFESVKNLKKHGLIIFSILAIYSIYIHSNAIVFKKTRCNEDKNWTFECISPGK